MKSLKISSEKFSRRGFTLIEVLIVLSLFIFISSVGLFLSFDSLASQRFFSEQKILVSLLKVARNRAFNNVNQNSHGIFISEDYFIVFEGESFDPDSDTNEIFPRNSNLQIEPQNSEIVFENLSSRSSAEQIILTDQIRTVEIEIEKEGQIKY